jgi:hypothetical protein
MVNIQNAYFYLFLINFIKLLFKNLQIIYHYEINNINLNYNFYDF